MSPVGQRKLSPPGFRALPARFGEVLAGRVWTVNYQLLRDAIGQIFHRLVFVVNLSRSITGRAFSSDLVSAHDSTVSPYGSSPILHDCSPRRLGPLLHVGPRPDEAARKTGYRLGEVRVAIAPVMDDRRLVHSKSLG